MKHCSQEYLYLGSSLQKLRIFFDISDVFGDLGLLKKNYISMLTKKNINGLIKKGVFGKKS